VSREEHIIQCAIARYLEIALPQTALFFAVPNGAHLAAKEIPSAGGKSKRFSAAAAKLKREGLKPGVADIIVIDAMTLMGETDSRVIALEVKAPNGRQSTEQKEWAQKASGCGVRYYVVKSVEDVAAALDREGVRLRARPSKVPGRLYDRTS
jgi:hypothetical protein